ncbi:hypothetical protein SAM23877_7450 [Streptomyces ambofaciens ATCC 23877]|uniref:Uncharacterized protein n=1 Tax=Streptomyces ambofaciens (strain ATCC 23877 / 3486 / DSM 40053 / JCM 4204 / NBRC 12836 / NRRL B-2516) TaxID=278992 RepID=A0A0K2B5S6_STRA7|nr:hypothetical protein SAM23877_0222 [Streptomyces ambofaciens ATCC 23877]AKZ60491.1 hypothetical protein SAM23877_7450 [Streptomyces ambofaciens ATCC 23877]
MAKRRAPRPGSGSVKCLSAVLAGYACGVGWVCLPRPGLHLPLLRVRVRVRVGEGWCFIGTAPGGDAGLPCPRRTPAASAGVVGIGCSREGGSPGPGRPGERPAPVGRGGGPCAGSGRPASGSGCLTG